MKTIPTLNDSEKLVKDHIKNYLDKATMVNNLLPSMPKEPNDLNGLVQFCMMKYDAQQGIKWHINNDSLIRDARGQRKEIDHAKVDAWAWSGQFYNSCRAALLLLEFYKKDDDQARQRIMDMLNDVPISNNYDNLAIKTKADLELYHRKLIDEMAAITNSSVKTIRDQIKLAINCTSLDDPHYHISTIMKGPNDDLMIESDIKMYGLNKQLEEVFDNVARDKPIDQNQYYDWYRGKKDGFEEFIAREGCKKIRGSSHIKIIPTQFRAVIPGLKNAYLEVTSVKRKEEELSDILRNYRSGVPEYPKDELITKEGIKVFSEQTKSEKIYLNSLLSGNEEGGASIFKIIKDIDKGIKVYNAQTPVNIVRHIERRKVDEYESLLKEISVILPTEVSDDIKKFIGNKSTTIGKIFPLKDDKDEKGTEMGKAVQNLIECRRLINRTASWRSPGSSDNYELAARMGIAIFDVQHGALSQYDKKQNFKEISRLTFCKSGKDRTGVTMRLASDIAFERAFGKSVCKTTIAGGHQQFMPGMNNTPLSYGIKSSLMQIGGGSANLPKQYYDMARETSYGNLLPIAKASESESELFDIALTDDVNVKEETAEAEKKSAVAKLKERYQDVQPKHQDDIALETPKQNYQEPYYKANDYRRNSEEDRMPSRPKAAPSGGEISQKEMIYGIIACYLMILLFSGFGVILAAVVAVAALDKTAPKPQRYEPPQQRRRPTPIHRNESREQSQGHVAAEIKRRDERNDPELGL